jgi:hypothetical protein
VVWKNVNRQKVDTPIKKSLRISQTPIVEKLNISLACVNEITAGLAYKTCVHDGYCVSLSPKLRQQDWKHISDYTLATKVRVMIFCTEMSHRMRVGCITPT